jgi:hypothetical protein
VEYRQPQTTSARHGGSAHGDVVMIRTRVLGPIAALLASGALFAACGTSSQSGSPSATSGATTGPTPTAVASPSDDSSPGAVTIKAIPTKRWGDPAFAASATAPGGAKVTYAANGGCKVEAKSGKVTIQKVGTCTVTATADSGGTASTKFKIEPGRPIIEFGARETRFKSALHFNLKASVDLPIPLAYKVIQDATGTVNDNFCDVTNDGFLVWTVKPTRTDHPAMDAKCMVRVSAAETSKNYSAPEPVRAIVHIMYPSWKVNAANQTRTATQDGEGRWYVTVTVNEDNGSALGMDVSGDCGSGDTNDQNIKAGTTVYKVRVYVNDPTSGTYSCTMHASALPQDYHQGNAGTSDVDFTLTVKKP